MQKFSIGVPIQPTEKSLTFAAKNKIRKKQMMKNYILIPLLTLLTTGLRAQENKSYRPFVEDGKVWTFGWISKDRMKLELLEYYYFDGDTVINHQPCKRMMSRMYDEKVPTYQGAFYEKDRRVYCCYPDSEEFTLLYDFAAEVGDTVVISDTISCYIVNKGPMEIENVFKGTYWKVAMTNLVPSETFSECWLEGIGATPIPFNNNVLQKTSKDFIPCLLSCTVGDEVLGINIYQWEDVIAGSAQEPKSIPYEIFVDGGGSGHSKKPKQKIDFTHVVKKQPKREGETVVGSFTGDRLFVNMGKLYDLYTVTITDSIGQVVYTKQVMTDNVLALNIDISDLPYSDYTVTVENDEYTFTGRFFCSPPYDYDGDRILTLNDITTLINIYLTDEDGLVTVSDVTALLEIYLNKDKK